MLRKLQTVAVLFVLLTGIGYAPADEIVLSVDDAPPGGLVVARIDLTSAARWCKSGPVVPDTVRAVTEANRQAVPFQFVPDPDYDAENRIAGTAVLRLSQPGGGRLRLKLEPADKAKKKPWDGTVATPAFTVTHDPKKLGGLPSRITFPATGKQFDTLRWHDRTYHRQLGGFRMIDDPEPKVERVCDGPLCTVVRVEGRYMRPDGTRPPSMPEATYQWFYFHDQPLVYVTVMQRQREPFAWHEWHFLELNYPGEVFSRWAGGEPIKQGEFTGSNESPRFLQWVALVDQRNGIAMLKSGQMSIHDGKGGYGAYLHAHTGVAWTPFEDTQRRLSAWLRIASDDEPTAAIQAAAERLPTEAHVTVTVDTVRDRIEAARKEIADLERSKRQQAWWRTSGAEQLEAQGRFQEAVDAAAGRMPPDWSLLTAGDLGAIFERTDDGVRLLELSDVAAGRQLLASEPLPLFTLSMRNAQTKEEVRLHADGGWNEVQTQLSAGERLDIHWRRPNDERLGGLSVSARATADDALQALRWTVNVENPSNQWSVWRVVFPQVALAELGPEASVFVPRAAGEVQQGVWRRAFNYQGTYPSGWTSMPFMAAYDETQKTGLYVAVHDSLGSTKDIQAKSRPESRSLVLSIDHPAPDMGKPGNRFELSGQAVWQLLRGDWFDAAVIYRDWVRQQAEWFPELTTEGRGDTPQWMRNLSVWLVGGGAPGECVPLVKEFQEYMGVPVGFHWYNWHQIPFDNDYPHYFPTKEGFTEAVRELQAAGVYVMPYINGRLWDTRDRGAEDFQFSRTARPAATKDEQGQPYTETYGSKESDASRVTLAAMCPTTDLWQNKVRQIVLQLMNECGVNGVYIDQVAAASPRLCFDQGHGHPTGGGHWWTQDGYWPLMERIHQAMPEDRMLTTECNAEPFARWFDGYLTWHWQYDGQVAAFPAVYGGAIQMFGRAYRGGSTKDLALRMKAGQQLVFGEQIGWIHPNVVREKENAEFLRQVVHLRARLVRYFYAGEMARPPKLVGKIPTVTADWQWSGEWPVTTDVVMVGAWRLPRENRLVLLFVNVGDEPVSAKLDFDARKYSLDGGELSVVKVTSEGTEETFSTTPVLQKELTFAPRKAWAWELTRK